MNPVSQTSFVQLKDILREDSVVHGVVDSSKVNESSSSHNLTLVAILNEVSEVQELASAWIPLPKSCFFLMRCSSTVRCGVEDKPLEYIDYNIWHSKEKGL